MQEERRYYRLDEVARLLRVSVQTVRRLIAKDKIAHMHTPGNALRIYNKRLSDYCRAGKISGLMEMTNLDQ
jgi:excisionase family DNA binding protein